MVSGAWSHLTIVDGSRMKWHGAAGQSQAFHCPATIKVGKPMKDPALPYELSGSRT
jgi:hypothetical protein